MHVIIHILWLVFYAANILLALYFIQPVLYFFLHLILPKKLYGKYKKIETEKEFDFAAVITVHQDPRFIAPLVDSFSKQHYNNFVVYVVADDCDITGLHFADKRIKILKPEPALNGKTKSIKFAVDNFVRKHDVLIIFDSDNLVHPDYLKNLNVYFQHGFKVVQTHMLSKNIDSVYARLDSIGHIYNNFLERQVKMELGLSSAILGLGISIDLDLYKEIFYKDSLGGFDKRLQIQLVQKVKQIGFAKDCIVYDEKVEDGATLEKQRTRWINTYFKYFKQSINLFINGIIKFNMSQVLLGMIMLRPPLFMTFFLAFIFAIIGFIFKPIIGIVWCVLILLFAINFVLIIATQSRQKGMVQSLAHIPKIVIRQMKSLLKIKSATKSFLKTEHQNVIYIDDILNNQRI
jgi:cellulose synthase/poly-beta-1,6-N-acetylglucosamine synthase-like glycosyltransferase